MFTWLLALEIIVPAPPYGFFLFGSSFFWYFFLRSSIWLSFSLCFQSYLCLTASITTILCLTAIAKSWSEHPSVSCMSVIRFDTMPICSCCSRPFFIRRLPSWFPYSSSGSKPTNSLKGRLLATSTPLRWGITRTVSPSASAPERIWKFLWLIPTASLASLVIIRSPSAFLLLTLSVGISNWPACGKRIRETVSPSLKFGA